MRYAGWGFMSRHREVKEGEGAEGPDRLRKWRGKGTLAPSLAPCLCSFGAFPTEVNSAPNQRLYYRVYRMHACCVLRAGVAPGPSVVVAMLWIPLCPSPSPLTTPLLHAVFSLHPLSSCRMARLLSTGRRKGAV